MRWWKKKQKTETDDILKSQDPPELEDIEKETVDKEKQQKDYLRYKQRILRGESEMSSKAGLQSYGTTGSEQVLRLTKYQCPKCSTILHNIKLDGIHFYCPKCEVHHHWSKL